jgi:hypothetical protein
LVAVTQIVTGCTTKKELREYAKLLNSGTKYLGIDPLLTDPSIHNPMRGGVTIPLREIFEGEVWIVTNHPKRSWFAKVERRMGKLLVS